MSEHSSDSGIARGGNGRSLSGAAGVTTAAFFDLDGTLVPGPTLERRLMRFLYWRREWSPLNFAWWVARYLKVCALPSSLSGEDRWVLATHGNKTYWKNVRVAAAAEFGMRGPGIEFSCEGIERARWHVSQGHKIFLVSGTLELLAQFAAEDLRRILGAVAAPEVIGVCATRLAEDAGLWTGEVRGPAIWGKGKARAIERLELEHGIDLAHSFAYANSVNDCAMLAKVGHPTAVNPGRGLRRIAKAHGWPIVLWQQGEKRNAKIRARNAGPLRVASTQPSQSGLPGSRR